MKRRSQRIAPTCLAAALLLMLAPWASAQVLDQVPADALVVIKFNKLKATNDKLAAMANKLGIAQLQPDFGDPLGAFKRESKIQNGLDENGEAAFVIANGPSQRGEPPMILLLPVSDYKAFLGNFADAKTTGDVTSFKFGGNPTSYAANWGKYAAVSQRQEMVTAKPSAGLKVAGLAAKELNDKDVVAYVNMRSARTKVLPGIAQARQQFLRNLDRGFQQMSGQPQPRRRPGAGAAPAPAAPAAPATANANAKFLPVMKAFFSRAFDTVEQIATDADSATYGASITDDGIRITGAAEFAASSPSGQQVAKLKGANQSHTMGLPQTKYMAFGGMQSATSSGGELFNLFVAPIEKEIAALGAEGKPLQDYLNSARKYMEATKGSTFGWVMPSGALGQEAIVQVVSVATGDTKAMLAAQKEMAQTQDQFMQMFQPPGMGQMKATYTENAKTVDGVSLNLMKTEFGAAAPGQQQTPQMMQMRQMMSWMYGPTGMTAYYGAVGADKMIAAVGTNDATLQLLVASAKANQDPLSKLEPVQAVDAQLPKQRFMTVYVAIDNIAMTIANYAKMFGMPINFQLPPDLKPIGLSVASDGPALRVDYYVPAETVSSVVAGVMQTYMQMQGGQQPGGPAGL